MKYRTLSLVSLSTWMMLLLLPVAVLTGIATTASASHEQSDNGTSALNVTISGPPAEAHEIGLHKPDAKNVVLANVDFQVSGNDVNVNEMYVLISGHSSPYWETLACHGEANDEITENLENIMLRNIATGQTVFPSLFMTKSPGCMRADGTPGKLTLGIYKFENFVLRDTSRWELRTDFVDGVPQIGDRFQAVVCTILDGLGCNFNAAVELSTVYNFDAISLPSNKIVIEIGPARNATGRYQEVSDSEAVSCTDSDGGRDFYRKGFVNSGPYENWDVCNNNEQLVEYFCSNNQIERMLYGCPNGCRDGVCIESAGEKDAFCGNGIIEVGEQCDDGNTINGDGCSVVCTIEREGMDACLDDPDDYWDQETNSCFSGFSKNIIKELCSDPDGGKNYYEGAHTYGFRSFSTADDPSKDLRIRTGGKDSCSSDGRLTEHYCDDNGYIRTTRFQCPNGCSEDGMACATEEGQGGFKNSYWQCYDGKESFEGGPTSCKSSETWQEYSRDFCAGRCYADGSKCGVTIFRVWNSCRTDEPLEKPEEVEEEVPERPTYDRLERRLIPPAGYEEEVRTTHPGYSWFTDISTETEVGEAANALADRKIIGGYPDGEFKAHRAVNRAEAAKFLMLARWGDAVKEGDQGDDSFFWDVKLGEWYVPYVIAAAELGVISGHPDGSFRPADGVNTAEFLKMLAITFGLQLNLPFDYLDVSKTAWFARYVGIAQRYDLFPDRQSYLSPAQKLTRGEVARAIYRILENQ